MAMNASRTKTGAATKKAITGTSKSSSTKSGRNQTSSVSSLMDKYSQSAAGSKSSRYGGGTNVLPTASPTIRPTFTAPKTGVEAAALTGATSSATGGSGGSATGTPVTPATTTPTGATGTDINSNLTGNVGTYGIRPDAIPMLYQEPQALLRMAMASMGQSANDNPGMYQMALPNADLVNALSMIGLGGNKDYNAGEHDKVLNYMDNLFRQGLTKGGQVVDFSQGMQNIVGADKASPLASMLQNDDPRGQYSALSSLMLPLAEAGLHPLFARSLQKSMEALRDEYYQRYANGTPPTSMAENMNKRLGLGG